MAQYISQLYPKGKTPFIKMKRTDAWKDATRPLSPLHRAELIEALEQKGMAIPERRLVEQDYWDVLGRDLTDIWEDPKKP